MDPTNPQAGFYLIKLNPKGWAVPAEIIRDGEFISVTCNGAQVVDRLSATVLQDAFVEATIEGRLFEHPLFRVVLFGELCDETTFRYRTALRTFAIDNAPWHPCLHPEHAIDPNTLPASRF